MAGRILVISVAAWAVAVSAHAQTRASRFYVGGTASADAGKRGNIPEGSVPSVGGLMGIRLTDAWALEVEFERAFRTTHAGSGEAVLQVFPPFSPPRIPTREEIELYGVRTRDERTQTAGAGWAAHAVWRSREPGRVNVGLLMGVASRVYDTRLVRTTTFVSPFAVLPPNYHPPDGTSSRRMAAGGLSGGLVIFLKVTDTLTIAPDFRFTTGLITDDPYTVFRSGVRAMYTFR
jgi:hypothetical protein